MPSPWALERAKRLNIRAGLWLSHYKRDLATCLCHSSGQTCELHWQIAILIDDCMHELSTAGPEKAT